MLFNSLHFLVFFLLVTLLFFTFQKQQSRLWLLLIASCYFYMSFLPIYILIMGGIIITDYFAGLLLQRTQGSARKALLALSLLINIGTLAVFKYYNFFIDNLQGGFQFFGGSFNSTHLSWLLPIGLSFHTFQAMSYTIEVYRRNQTAERNFVVYAVYVLFYPQLVAGPIERPQNILPQLHTFRAYNTDNVRTGLSQMLWGFFKKVVIADRLAMIVDYSYLHTHQMSGVALLFAAIAYSFQIYCDFSGYSDIALGAARVMNITLMDNFKQPYLSATITTFWRNWHISLSSWFRDYVYIPLGGNRKSISRTHLNVFLVFLLSGLWHGANFTFVVWGALHGLLVVIAAVTNPKLPKTRVYHLFSILFTFLTVTILWVFFRSPNIHTALAYIKRIATCSQGMNYTGVSRNEVLFSIALIIILLLREKFIPSFEFKNKQLFYVYASFLIIVSYLFGVFAENQFIYFQF